MNYHKKPETLLEINKLIETIASQCQEAAEIKGKINCICGRKISVFSLFRCFHCGLYLCDRCAKKHFGKKPDGFLMKLRKR